MVEEHSCMHVQHDYICLIVQKVDILASGSISKMCMCKAVHLSAKATFTTCLLRLPSPPVC